MELASVNIVAATVLRATNCIERSQITLYHAKNFSIEEVRLGLDMKLGWIGHTERISHSGFRLKRRNPNLLLE